MNKLVVKLKDCVFAQSNMSRVMGNPDLHICENKDADQLRATAKLISAFVFATRIVQSLYFLNLKFQASSYFLWLHSSACVGPGRKARSPVFSQRGSFVWLDRIPGNLCGGFVKFFRLVHQGS